MAHQPIKPGTYAMIYVALLALTGTTVYVANHQDSLRLERYEIPIALGIASVKTLLVGIFFMHLMHARPLVWLVMVLGVLFLGVMVTVVLTDYWTRGWVLSPGWVW